MTCFEAGVVRWMDEPEDGWEVSENPAKHWGFFAVSKMMGQLSGLQISPLMDGASNHEIFGERICVFFLFPHFLMVNDKQTSKAHCGV